MGGSGSVSQRPSIVTLKSSQRRHRCGHLECAYYIPLNHSWNHGFRAALMGRQHYLSVFSAKEEFMIFSIFDLNFSGVNNSACWRNAEISNGALRSNMDSASFKLAGVCS